MKILTYPVGHLQANCYLLIQDTDCIIIDPGDSADFLLEQIQRKNLNLLGLFATHGHFDHVMAVGEIQIAFGNIPFYIHKKDHFLLRRLEETSKHFLRYDPHIIDPIQIKNIKIGKQQIKDFKFEIISTPGHTPGSCCYFFKEEGVIFTGDTLFKEGIGSYNHSYSSKIDLLKSIKNIRTIATDFICYSGHGEEFLLI